MNDERRRDPAAYAARVHEQDLQWASGFPQHNRVDDECCADFSCCYPELFTKSDAARWETYYRAYPSKRN